MMKKPVRKVHFEATCSICNHLPADSPFKIWEYSDSILYLNQDQFFEGYCILEYKKHVKELFELTDRERNLYMKHVSLAAKALQKVFNPDKLNYELLGNKVPHLHWHIIPRFNGDPAWSDPVWSKPHGLVQYPINRIKKLVSEILKHL